MIRTAEENDIGRILELFTRYIDNSFFIGLGKDFPKIFPGSLINSPGALNYVCTADSRIVGFICSVYDFPVFLRRIFFKRGFALLTVILGSALKKPAILKELWGGFLYARRMRGDQAKAELLYIAIEPDLRSRGIATRLIDHTLREIKKRGICKVRVSTDQSNTAINRLLLRSGFEIKEPFNLFGKKMYLYDRRI